VKSGGKFGYIDTTGTTVISPQFDSAVDFSESLAVVFTGPNCSFINRSGDVVITVGSFNDNAGSFFEGLAWVRDNGRYGYMNRTGAWAIEPLYYGGRNFGEGLAAVKVEGKWGYIDTAGQMVISPQFDDARRFFEGRSKVMIGDKWGYINKAGSQVVSPQFVFTDRFSEGLAGVVTGDLKVGFIDTTGTFVVAPQFDAAFGFSEGLAPVNLGGTPDTTWTRVDGGKWGWIDKTGKYVWEPSE
jgi:hypothetical protein